VLGILIILIILLLPRGIVGSIGGYFRRGEPR
jgi:ABC-type branched-subunit amino acid transport system permease subunit